MLGPGIILLFVLLVLIPKSIESFNMWQDDEKRKRERELRMRNIRK
jgi:hypothetical protein